MFVDQDEKMKIKIECTLTGSSDTIKNAIGKLGNNVYKFFQENNITFTANWDYKEKKLSTKQKIKMTETVEATIESFSVPMENFIKYIREICHANYDSYQIFNYSDLTYEFE